MVPMDDEQVMYKSVWITTKFKKDSRLCFLVQDEYQVSEKIRMVVYIVQRDFRVEGMPEESIYDEIVYNVHVWEEYNEEFEECTEDMISNSRTIYTNYNRCQVANAFVKLPMKDQQQSTNYLFDLRLMIQEPLETTTTSIIKFD